MSRLTANLSMTNELAEEYRELKRNLIPILLQICGKAFNHVREEGIPLAPIQVDKFTKVLVNGVTLCLIGTFEGKSENDFIKEISGKVYVKAGTDSVDVINLQTKRYKVQYT